MVGSWAVDAEGVDDLIAEDEEEKGEELVRGREESRGRGEGDRGGGGLGTGTGRVEKKR